MQSTKCNQISSHTLFLCDKIIFFLLQFVQEKKNAKFMRCSFFSYLVLSVPVPVKYRITKKMFIVYSFLTLSTKPNWLFYLLRACAHFQFHLNSSEVFSVFLMHETHSTHNLAQMFIDAKTTEKKYCLKQMQNFEFYFQFDYFRLWPFLFLLNHCISH